MANHAADGRVPLLDKVSLMVYFHKVQFRLVILLNKIDKFMIGASYAINSLDIISLLCLDVL